MKSTVTHTSQKLSGDMNSAHTPAEVLLYQKSFNLLSEGERERERLHSVKNLVPYQAKI
jgi:hypothetical protein